MQWLNNSFGLSTGTLGSGLRFSVLCMLCVMLFACSRGNDMTDLQQYVVEVSLRPGGDIEPMPQFLPYEAFTYGAASMRAPFDIPVMAGTSVAKEPVSDVKPDFDRAPEPLESFTVSTLNMVGMISRGTAYVALVRDEAGSIHRVVRGNYLGKNYGRVTAVTPTEIELVEIVPSGDGGWVERPRTLALQR